MCKQCYFSDLSSALECDLDTAMAKFVLAGKADCPYFAKAELLADLLWRILPDFRIHKICVHPDDWKTWLDDTCRANGWKHEGSPVVWRELVERGGKGSLVGGFSDFLEHAQGYYGVVYDVGTELALKMAGENLEGAERQRREVIQPFQIWICSALDPVCYNLIPSLFVSETLRHFPLVDLHLLDLDASRDSLSGLRMEVEDLALPRLHQVMAHSDLSVAFRSADLVIFLDDDLSRVKSYGQILEARAKQGVRVLVAGGASPNLKCTLLMESMPSVDRCSFVAVATHLQNARAQIATKLSVRTSDITGVIGWGNIGGSFHVDLQRATVSGYDGAIWGPDGFRRNVLDLVHDGKWLTEEFPCLVESRRRAVSLRTNRVAAISATDGIVTVLDAWINSSSPEVFSVGVASTGHFGVPAGLVFCLPVSFQGGGWSICSDLTISQDLRSKLEAAVSEIRAEKVMTDGTKTNDPAP